MFRTVLSSVCNNYATQLVYLTNCTKFTALRRPTLTPSLSLNLSRSKLLAYRLLSTETRSQIQRAVSSSPVVLFMKGTPSRPECGFSRAVVQVLDLHGVPEDKFKAFNVL